MCHACHQSNRQLAADGSKAAQRIARGPEPLRAPVAAPTRHPGSKPPRRIRIAHRRRKQRAARRRNRT